jgi:hypothetical protein
MIVMSDLFSDSKLKLDLDPKVKSKIIRPATTTATFFLHWKSAREGSA